MLTVKACIFDLDGVIVDTAKYHYMAWNRLAKELGYEFTEEQNELFKGVSRMKCMDIMCELFSLKLNEDEKIELTSKKNDWYKEYIGKLDKSEILPGTLEFLQELKANNIKIALGSASRNAVPIIKILDLEKYFDAIIDGNKVTKAKPNPEVFLLGAEELGVKAEECIVFEDAEAGVEAAQRAGMKAIGIGKTPCLNKADMQISGLHEMDMDKLGLI